MRTLAAALLLVLARDARAAQDESSGLRCNLAVSIDTAFVDRWDHTNLPHMSVVGSKWVFRGQPFGVYPFFSAYALDEHGRAHVTLDLRITRPDGRRTSRSRASRRSTSRAETARTCSSRARSVSCPSIRPIRSAITPCISPRTIS